MRLLAAIALMLTASALLTGCQEPEPVEAGPEDYPADFSVVLTVRTARPGADALHHPTQYVLTPARKLHVARGPGIRHDLFPPVSAELTPRQMLRVWQAVAEHELLATDSANDLAGAEVTYELTLTARDEEHHYRTTPAASPGTRELLERLAAAAGVR
ncbi:MAG: hypothetical protein ACLFV3_09340 [Phycisphaeraceae bacterium]